MSRVISDQATGLRSQRGSVRSPKQLKAKSGNEFPGLSRCAACYNHDAGSSLWHGRNGDSSSSAEDSGSQGDCESEAESSSSGGGSGHVVAAASETPETCDARDAAGPNCGGRGGTPQSQEDNTRTSVPTPRGPLVKSFSLPSSMAPHLTPSPLLPRPPRVVSTLQLQVLPVQHEDDTFITVHQHLSARQHENSEQSYGGAERMNGVLRPQPVQWQQIGSPWQLHPQYQQQQQVSYLFQPPPQQFCSAQGQMLPPPATLPVLHPLPLLQAHPHALSPQLCICCYQHFLNTHWSHYSSGQLLRW